MIITVEEEVESPITFPKLFINKESDMLVLFTDKTTGVLLWKKDIKTTSTKIGDTLTNWVDCSDIRYWRMFKGKLIFSNSI